MKKLDVTLLKVFLNKAVKSLQGNWLLIGGTLLPAVGLDIRTTVDIDFIGLGSNEKAQNLELMNLADSLGLSIESINQAAEFFLSKVGYSKRDLIVLKKDKKCIIYRPSAELYLRLKIARLSESDLLDCVHYFNFCKTNGDEINIPTILEAVQGEFEKKPNEDKFERLQKLKNFLGAP